MIYSVNGKIIVKDLNMVVIDCGGVGYGCRTTMSTLAKIGSIGENATLLTYLNVREDMVELFGFASNDELNCFKMLLTVSGVGPKAAIAILSDTTPERFALTVAAGDSKQFTKTKGIGLKTAQRIILELKDKIIKEQRLTVGSDAFDFSPVVEGSSISEAIAALVVLGYSQTDASVIVGKLDPNLSVEEMIKHALKKL